MGLCLIPQGDNSIIAYEYVEDKKPYLFDVAPFACGSPHQVRDRPPITLPYNKYIIATHLLAKHDSV